MLLAAELVLLGLALVAAVVLRGPRRPALALAALLVPVSLTAPGTAKELVEKARRDAELGPAAAALAATPSATRGRNLPLLYEAERRITPGSDYGIVRGRPREGQTGRRVRARSYGIAWMQFRLAPRVAKRGADAPWVLVFDSTPEREGIPARRTWQFGNDWLVQR